MNDIVDEVPRFSSSILGRRRVPWLGFIALFCCQNSLVVSATYEYILDTSIPYNVPNNVVLPSPGNFGKATFSDTAGGVLFRYDNFIDGNVGSMDFNFNPSIALVPGDPSITFTHKGGVPFFGKFRSENGIIFSKGHFFDLGFTFQQDFGLNDHTEVLISSTIAGFEASWFDYGSYHALVSDPYYFSARVGDIQNTSKQTAIVAIAPQAKLNLEVEGPPAELKAGLEFIEIEVGVGTLHWDNPIIFYDGNEHLLIPALGSFDVSMSMGADGIWRNVAEIDFTFDRVGGSGHRSFFIGRNAFQVLNAGSLREGFLFEFELREIDDRGEIVDSRLGAVSLLPVPEPRSLCFMFSILVWQAVRRGAIRASTKGLRR